MDSGIPSPVQWDALLNFIENDEEMLTGISHHPGGKSRMTKKWDTLAILVNAADPESAKKSGEKWKSAWNGLKCRARKSYRDKVSPTWIPGTPLPHPDNVADLSPRHRRVVCLTGFENAMASVRLLQAPEDIDAPAAVPAGVANPPALVQQVEVAAAAALPQLAAVGDQLPACVANPCVHVQRVEVEPAGPLVVPKGEPDDNWLPFVWADGNGVHTIDLEAGPAMALKQEFLWNEDEGCEVITISDTPVKATKSQVSAMTHTPPRGSGLTPSSKRRLTLSPHGGAVPRVKPEPASLGVVHEGSHEENVMLHSHQLFKIVTGNTLVMKNLLILLQSCTL